MELDSQSLDSDEGVELSVKEHEDIGDLFYNDEIESTVLEAKIVYLLLPKNVPVSRASRLQWLLDHLNTVITVPVLQKWNISSNVIEVVSAIAREQHTSKCNRYLINCRTEVIFLAHTYRFVYCLDMSPSQAIVDIQKGEILFDEILNSFKASVEGLTRQFTIPGNSLIFQPSLYLTVMVNTPFFMSPAQQVLVKGVQITSSNIQEIISFVQNQFHLLEGKIADVTAMVHDQNEFQKMQYEGIVGSLFDLPENEKINAKVPMVSPDANFVNMLRYSMLAVSLLPENSISHILVITDGVVAMPDSNIMETILTQLHYDSIAVSFIKVGSSFHPHSSAGYISYTDLLKFFSYSTMGTCLESSPDIVSPL